MRRRWLWLAGAATALALLAYLSLRHGAELDSAPPDSRAEQHTAPIEATRLRRPATAATLHAESASLAGTVTDGAARPVAGARVCTVPVDDFVVATDTLALCATTDASGRYAIHDLVPTLYLVTASARGFLPDHADAGVLPPNQPRTGVDFQLVAGGVEVTGTVTDRGGGPIAHALVSAFSPLTYVSTPVVETDETGAFRLWAWSGWVGVEASAEGYTTRDIFGTGPFHLELTPAGSIAGTVVDAATHAPIAGAAVSRGGGVDAVTDANGAFRIDGLAPGRHGLEAHAAHAFGATEGDVPVVLGQHVSGVEIALRPAATVSGRLTIAGTPPTACPRPALMLLHDGDNRYSASRPEPDGVVRIDGVRPGVYDVLATCEGFEPLAPPAKLDVRDADLDHLAWAFGPAGAITGHVRGVDGAPVAGASVTVRGETATTATTRADGSYRITGLAAGDYTFAVHASAGVLTERVAATVQHGETVTRDLQLAAGGAIAGRVVTTTGAAASGVSVMGSRLDGEATTDATGRFRFDNAPAGEYQVSIRDPGALELVRARVTVIAGQTAEVTLVVQPAAGEITGRVVDPAGRGVPDAVVTASREFGEILGAAGDCLTAPDGSFRLRALPAGTYTLDATRPGAATGRTPHVALGAVATIRLGATGSLAGTVRAADGSPVTDVLVTVNERRERFYGTAGRFHLGDLPPGAYTIVANTEDAEGSLPITLAEGAEITGVTVTLGAGAQLTGRLTLPASDVDVGSVGCHLAGGGKEYTSRIAAGGGFTFRALPRGALDCSAYGVLLGGVHAASFHADTSAGDTIDVGDVILAD